MKINLPSPKTMHEYLLSMGENWVCDTYGIDGDIIDEIIYGFKLPTEERQFKKNKKMLKMDEGRVAFMNKMYKDDHFIWDMPNKNHIRCQNAVEVDPPDITESFIVAWLCVYKSLMEWDMRINNNGMLTYGWSLGERIINKTTSKTSDDNIHDRMLRYLESGKMLKKRDTFKVVVFDGLNESGGHNLKNEDFLDYVESGSMHHKDKAIRNLPTNMLDK